MSASFELFFIVYLIEFMFITLYSLKSLKTIFSHHYCYKLLQEHVILTSWQKNSSVGKALNIALDLEINFKPILHYKLEKQKKTYKRSKFKDSKCVKTWCGWDLWFYLASSLVNNAFYFFHIQSFPLSQSIYDLTLFLLWIINIWLILIDWRFGLPTLTC